MKAVMVFVLAVVLAGCAQIYDPDYGKDVTYEVVIPDE